MIHDPVFEVTCDGDKCSASEMIDGEYRQGYRCTDAMAAAALGDWLVDGGKHYCPSCKEER